MIIDTVGHEISDAVDSLSRAIETPAQAHKRRMLELGEGMKRENEELRRKIDEMRRKSHG